MMHTSTFLSFSLTHTQLAAGGRHLAHILVPEKRHVRLSSQSVSSCQTSGRVAGTGYPAHLPPGANSPRRPLYLLPRNLSGESGKWREQ